MEWIKIPVADIVSGKFTNLQIAALVKYQALFASLEQEPTDRQLVKNLTPTERAFIADYASTIREQVADELSKVQKKRRINKISYCKSIKQGEIKISESNLKSGADKIREDKKRIEKNINKKSFLSDFETWWAEYPNKKSKQDALRIFEKLLKKNKVTFDELLAGAKAYAEHCRREKIEPQYIKHPSTWLNQGCWADEYAPPELKNKNRWSVDDADNAKWEAFFQEGLQ